MPTSCCAFGCSNRGGRDKVQFFSFPQCSERKKQWLVAIRRDNFTPSKYHKICSAHFIDKDYLIRPNINFPRLNDEAVPSVFNFPKHLIKPVKTRRATKKMNQNIPNTITTDGPSCSNIDTSDINVVSEQHLIDENAPEKNKIKVSSGIIALKKKVKCLQQKVRRQKKTIINLQIIRGFYIMGFHCTIKYFGGSNCQLILIFETFNSRKQEKNILKI